MNPNPYKYKEPLDPEADGIVCVTRIKEVNRVIEGINRGSYWAIFGPKHIGKTTFLRLIKHAYPGVYYIYLDLKTIPAGDESVYQNLKNQLLAEIPSEYVPPLSKEWKHYPPALQFINFLEKFKPKKDKTIIFLFDDIDALSSSSLSDLLKCLRKIFHERNNTKELKRYISIVAGTVNLLSHSIGPNSPYNISQKLYLKDFSNDESTKLIEEPLKQLNIKIENKAKKTLISYLSGHPQMIQHVCHILVDRAFDSNRTITSADVDRAIELLLVTNSNLALLQKDLKNNRQLASLLQDIFNGKKRTYFPYKEFSLLSSGPIVEHNSLCVIRNKIFHQYIQKNVVIKEVKNV